MVGLFNFAMCWPIDWHAYSGLIECDFTACFESIHAFSMSGHTHAGSMVLDHDMVLLIVIGRIIANALIRDIDSSKLSRLPICHRSWQILIFVMLWLVKTYSLVSIWSHLLALEEEPLSLFTTNVCGLFKLGITHWALISVELWIRSIVSTSCQVFKVTDIRRL